MAGLTSASNDRMLLMVGGAVLGFSLLVWLMWPSPPSELDRMERVPITGYLSPVWSNEVSAESTSLPAAAGDQILIYVDTSHSMAGFFPPPGASEPERTSLRTVAQLAPGHVLATGSGTSLWYTVAQQVSTTPSPTSPPFEQATFTGGSSDLGAAVEAGIEALETGRARTVVLISDLVATGDAKGAMGVGQALLDWLDSPSVRSGRFDAGLLGIRLPYWGAVTHRCDSPTGLGCWYSEHADRYYPLERVAERPAYLLVLGATGTEDDDPSASQVERAGRSLHKSLHEMDLDARWELLTGGSRVRAATLSCTAAKEDGKKQYALFRARNGTFTCRQDEKVVLTCGAQAPGMKGPLEVLRARATWPQVLVQSTGEGLLATIDCAALREAPPSGDLRLTDLEISPPKAPVESWNGWSTTSDEVEELLAGTLQLDLFLDSARLRPRAYRLELDEPLLRGGPQ